MWYVRERGELHRRFLGGKPKETQGLEDLAVDRIILKWMRCELNSWDSEYRQVVGPSGSGNKTFGGLLDCQGLLSFSRRTLFHVVSTNFTVQMIFCGTESDTSESKYTANWKLSGGLG